MNMNKAFLSLMVLMFLGLSSAFAQSEKHPIEIKNITFGHDFIQDGTRLTSVKQIKQAVGDDKEALRQLRWASFDVGVSYTLSFAGGFAMGMELGRLITGKGVNAPVLIAGVGTLSLGFLFIYLADRRLVKGVSIYNDNLGTTSFGIPIELDFGLVPGGIGLTLSF